MRIYHMDAQGSVLRVIDDVISYTDSSVIAHGVGGLRRILGCDTAAGECFSPTPEPPAPPTPPSSGEDVDAVLDIVEGVI